jgi:uncharacterized protein (DUF302 family)
MKRSVILFSVLLLLSVTTWAQTQRDTEVITRPSAHSVPRTVELLKAAIKEAGLNVIAEIDHAGAASKNGLELRPTYTLLFGNPNAGTKLMQADQRAGLDLPLRMVVWQHKDGQVFVSYHDPAKLAASYQVSEQGEVLTNMQGVMEKLVQRINTAKR